MKPEVNRFLVLLAAGLLALILLLAGRWIYAAPDGGFELPPSPEITPEPAGIVYVSPSGSKYHRRECTAIANSEALEEMLPQEALESGFEPCLKCQPGRGR